MLDEFNIKYITTKPAKGKTVAKHLSNFSIEFGKEKDFLFPDEGVMEIKEDIWKMYFNGGSESEGLWSGNYFDST